MSPDVFAAMGVTRDFLFEHVYLAQLSEATKEAVDHVLLTLLEHHAAAPGLPEEERRVRAVDYVAGMTDRFAIRAFEDLVGGPDARLPSL
jgi:dGTPase